MSTAKKLLQAAALASALMPLGAVEADAATISCSVLGGCSGQTGSYDSGVSGSNLWKFFEGSTVVYTLQISGTPINSFDLEVEDRHVSVFSVEDFTLPAGVQCIPLYDPNTCVIFDVFSDDPFVTPEWDENGYFIEMRWLAPEGPTLMRPPDDGNNHIYRSAFGDVFNDQLENSEYDPFPDPVDPALSGTGDLFSSFLAGRDFASVPEPSTLLLMGAGVAAGFYRRRRRQG